MGASFDALSLSAVRDELETLVDGRVQKVVFPDETSVALEVFAPAHGRRFLLLSAHPENGRVQLVPHLPARGLERDTPFALLLRKHLRNARLRALRQPRLERILELEGESRNDAGRLHGVVLIVEAMGRRGNLVLVGEDGTILDAQRRSPPSRNPRRPVLPHLRYDPPPPQDRLMPEQVSAEELAFGARTRSGPLARYLSDRLAGLSPLAGRELAFRATGSADTRVETVDDWTPLVRAIAAFFAPLATHAWQPCLASNDDGPIDIAPYRLEHLAKARLESFPTLSEALVAYYERKSSLPVQRGDPLAAERKALLASIDRAARSTERRVNALEQQLASGEEQRGPLRRAGELLLAYQAQIPPQAAEGELEGEHITLDPDLSPVENAQAYFARYRRAREALEKVPPLLEDARRHREYLAELRALVEVADDMSAIRALRREVGEAIGERSPPKHKQAGKAASYRRVPLDDGWEAFVGASAAGNAAVTFDLAQSDDVWLHARGVPGAHVILRRAGPRAEPPVEVLERAAQLAAWHSAARTAGHVEVDAAPRRSVRKIPNSPPGLVRYANERTLRVEPRP
jgi:predicted ribosome quality control (RQC) complex YloA/Tae2 family protein